MGAKLRKNERSAKGKRAFLLHFRMPGVSLSKAKNFGKAKVTEKM